MGYEERRGTNCTRWIGARCIIRCVDARNGHSAKLRCVIPQTEIGPDAAATFSRDDDAHEEKVSDFESKSEAAVKPLASLVAPLPVAVR